MMELFYILSVLYILYIWHVVYGVHFSKLELYIKMCILLYVNYTLIIYNGTKDKFSKCISDLYTENYKTI